MASILYSDSNSSTRASDFLTFETLSYSNFNKDSSVGHKSQNDGSGSAFGATLNAQATGFGRSYIGNSASPSFGTISEDNFLLKGIEFVTSGASSIKKGIGGNNSYFDVSDNATLKNDSNGTFMSRISSAVSYGKNVLGFVGDLQPSSWKTYTNYKLFVILFVISTLFFVLSFMTLPFIVFAPRKFGLLFTCASVTFLTSLTFLKGVGPLMEHMFSSKRICFTLAYAISLVGSFVFSILYPVYLLAFLTSLVQAVSLASVIVSYIPGGANVLKAAYSSIWAYVKNTTGSSDMNVLPL